MISIFYLHCAILCKILLYFAWGIKNCNCSITTMMVKKVVIKHQQLQNGSTIEIFIKEKTCSFNKCIPRVLNFKEVHFINTSLNIKTIKYLKPYCFFCMNYTALGECFVIIIALGFMFCYICHLTLTLSCIFHIYKLALVLEVVPRIHNDF